MGVRISRIIVLIAALAAISAPLSASTISGRVRAGLPGMSRITVGVDNLSPAAGIDISAVSSSGKIIASGKTDDSGNYSLNVPAGRDGNAAFIQAETASGILRALPMGQKGDVDPVTEAVVSAVLDAGTAPANYGEKELAFINERLYGIASSVDFSTSLSAASALNLLMDHPDFNRTLGNLVQMYGMPGDNIAQIDNIEFALAEMLSGFPLNSPELFRKRLSRDAKINLLGENYDTEGIIKKAAEINEAFKNIDLRMEIIRININGDRAEALTFESLDMQPVDESDAPVHDSWVSTNKLLLKDGTWLLYERMEKTCVVENMSVKADGHISDWTGAIPCFYQKTETGSAESASDSITALYFAKDDDALYWRMDISKGRETTTVKYDGLPRGWYALYLFRDQPNNTCDTFMHFINNAVTNASSGGRACVIDSDGNNAETYFSYRNFAVGMHSVEGRIPLDDLSFLPGVMKAFGMMTRTARPANADAADGIKVITDSINIYLNKP